MDNYLRKIQMALTVTESNVAEFQRLCFQVHTDTETVILKTEKLAVAHHPIRRRTGEALGMRCAPSRTERSKIKVVNGGRACNPDSVPHANRKTASVRGDHSSRSRFAPLLQQPT